MLLLRVYAFKKTCQFSFIGGMTYDAKSSNEFLDRFSLFNENFDKFALHISGKNAATWNLSLSLKKRDRSSTYHMMQSVQLRKALIVYSTSPDMYWGLIPDAASAEGYPRFRMRLIKLRHGFEDIEDEEELSSQDIYDQVAHIHSLVEYNYDYEKKYNYLYATDEMSIKTVILENSDGYTRQLRQLDYFLSHKETLPYYVIPFQDKLNGIIFFSDARWVYGNIEKALDGDLSSDATVGRPQDLKYDTKGNTNGKVTKINALLYDRNHVTPLNHLEHFAILDQDYNKRSLTVIATHGGASVIASSTIDKWNDRGMKTSIQDRRPRSAFSDSWRHYWAVEEHSHKKFNMSHTTLVKINMFYGNEQLVDAYKAHPNTCYAVLIQYPDRLEQFIHYYIEENDIWNVYLAKANEAQENAKKVGEWKDWLEKADSLPAYIIPLENESDGFIFTANGNFTVGNIEKALLLQTDSSTPPLPLKHACYQEKRIKAGLTACRFRC